MAAAGPRRRPRPGDGPVAGVGRPGRRQPARLDTPFLVTTDSLVADVVTDADLVAQLTSGLTAVGAESLGLLPRGSAAPVRRPAVRSSARRLRGRRRARRVVAHRPSAMFDALGATTTDESLDPTTMLGAESSFRITRRGVATGNVVFYPKVNVLTLNADVEQGLTAEQRTVPARGRRRHGRLGARHPTPRTPRRADLLRRGGQIAGRDPGSGRQPGGRHPRCRRRPPRGPDDRRPDRRDHGEAARPGTRAGDLVPASKTTGRPGSTARTPSRSPRRPIRAAGGTDQGRIDENTGDFTVTLRRRHLVLAEADLLARARTPAPPGTGTGGYTFDGKHFQIFYSHDPGALDQGAR